MNRRYFFKALSSGLVAATSAELFLPKLVKPSWKALRQPGKWIAMGGNDVFMSDGIEPVYNITGDLVARYCLGHRITMDVGQKLELARGEELKVLGGIYECDVIVEASMVREGRTLIFGRTAPPEHLSHLKA